VINIIGRIFGAFFAILWCISPLVFIPLFIVYINKYNHLNKKYKYLMFKLNKFENESKSGTESINSENPVIQKPTQIYDEPKQQYKMQPILNSNQAETHQNEMPANFDDSISAESKISFKQLDSQQNTKEQIIAKKDSGVSTINIVLIVGVVFIVLAGIIFATTTWQSLPNLFRTIIIFSVTALFFGVSLLTEKQLKLEKTSIAFYFLGSIFLPICIISAGFFKLFGSWLSLFGDGKYLLLLFASILLGGAGFIGTQKYKLKSFAYTFYTCITISFICLLKQMYFNNNVFVLCLAIFSTIVIFAVSRFSYKENEKFSVLLSCINKFAIFNTIILGVVSTLSSQNSVIASLSAFIFAFIFLKNIFNPNEEGYGAFPFVILIIIGLYKLIVPENISDYMMIVAATAVTSAIVGQMGQFNKSLIKILNIVSIIMVAISIVFFGLPIAFSNSWTGATLISGAIMLLNLTWLSIKFKSKVALSFQPILLIILMQGFASFIFNSTCVACILLSALSLIAFIFYRKFNLIRTLISDISFTLTPLICMFVCLISGDNRNISSFELFNNYGFYMLICSTIFVMIVSLIVFEQKNSNSEFRKVFDWVLPISVFSIIYSFYSIFQSQWQLFFFVYFVIIIFFSTLSTVFQNKKESALRFYFCLEIYSYFIIYISVLLSIFNFNKFYLFPYFWIVSIFFGIKSYVSHKKEFMNMRNVFFYLTCSFIIAASIITTANLTEEKLLYILVPTFITIYSSICYILYAKIYKKVSALSFQLQTFFAIITSAQAVALMSIIVSRQNLSIVYFISCAICIIISYFMFLCRNKNVFAFIPVLIIYPFIAECFKKSGIANFEVYTSVCSVLVFFFIAFFARKMHQKIVLLNEGKSVIIDWLTIFNILVIFNIGQGKYYGFIIMLVFAIYPLIFINRAFKNSVNPYILTISSLFGVITFWLQPFLIIPEVIKNEVNLIPIVLFCFAFSFIWQDKKKMADIVCFSIAVSSIAFLLINAMLHELLIDALLLAVAVLIMVIASFMIKRKKWFILSLSVLLFLTVYMSRSFWLSLEWWVYLLSTGIILIATASINEIQKQKGTPLKSKMSRFMSEWKW